VASAASDMRLVAATKITAVNRPAIQIGGCS
jgi:hypothetical protein